MTPTLVEYSGSLLDYSALEQGARVKGQSGVVTASLSALKDDPTVQRVLGSLVDGQAIGYSTKLSTLGIEGDDRTVSELIVQSRKDVGLQVMVESGNLKGAVAVVLAMTDGVRASTPGAETIYQNVLNPKDGVAGDPYREIVDGMKTTSAQLRQIHASTTLTGEQTTAAKNANEGDYFRRAQAGDPTVIGSHDQFIQGQLDKGVGEAQAEVLWDKVAKAYGQADKTGDANLTLLTQAVDRGKPV